VRPDARRFSSHDAPLPLGCSEISDLHAEDPKLVFEAALAKLKQLLSAENLKMTVKSGKKPRTRRIARS
jgi:hypothetical protein